ncbi:PqqD family peptide modification chaperone [Bradyrhizobium sp. sGM-13]|uniref:PqqD family peptide modification chaperone n=1 Tax=Bradyrhizobium sp. sGM-13 TaxID=2831781 RepID=UPI001BCA946F|nr:PqqD family peptide modification chaperone [Bradyrhizobium sp. sGM-13]
MIFRPDLMESGPDSPVLLRPAADASFALIDDRPVLFSEKSQHIYELNQISAFAWCKLLDQNKLEGIADELSELGLGREQARNLLSQALQQWLDLELVEMELRLPFASALQTRLAQRAISIKASNEALIKSLEPLFCNLNWEGDRADITIEVVELGDEVLFRNCRKSITRCPITSLAPAIKADLTERIILQDQPDFALHAASLVFGDKGLLLCGQPGAGKSTLALQLVSDEYRYCGDDVVMISPNGLAQGLLFAPTIKPGTWEAISKARDDLSHATAHDRTDGIRVRYLPVADVHTGSFQVEWIIFLKRVDGTSAELKPLGQIESMQRVINGSFAANGKLSLAGFAALKKIISGAGLFELTYAEAADAGRKLRGLCHGFS